MKLVNALSAEGIKEVADEFAAEMGYRPSCARGSGEAHEIRALAATLDVSGMRTAWLTEDGQVEIRPIIELL